MSPAGVTDCQCGEFRRPRNALTLHSPAPVVQRPEGGEIKAGGGVALLRAPGVGKADGLFLGHDCTRQPIRQLVYYQLDYRLIVDQPPQRPVHRLKMLDDQLVLQRRTRQGCACRLLGPQGTPRILRRNQRSVEARMLPEEPHRLSKHFRRRLLASPVAPAPQRGGHVQNQLRVDLVPTKIFHAVRLPAEAQSRRRFGLRLLPDARRVSPRAAVRMLLTRFALCRTRLGGGHR